MSAHNADVGRRDAVLRMVDEAMRRGREQYDIPVVSYGVLHAGELIHTGSVAGPGHQPVTPLSQFRIASMTKSFTAATILLLRDRGLLSLQDRIDHWLPWAATIGSPIRPITVRHLLTMTGGFPTDDPWGDRQEPLPLPAFDDLVARGLAFCRPPGIAFEYSNLGYALLGRVITAVTGEPYPEVVARELLRPLGMTRSGYDVTDVVDRVQGYRQLAAGLVPQEETGPGAFSPMGGLWSCVADLARWVAGFEAAWWHDSEHPLERWTRREMQASQVGVRSEADAMASYGYGLYVTEGARGTFVHHSGGYPGYGSHMRWHPDTRWAVVGLGNRTYAPMAPIIAELMHDMVNDEHAAAAQDRQEKDLWPQTRAALDVAERLLVEWDDAAVDAIAAMNLDLDQPRAERREQWRQLCVERGPFTRRTLLSRSPAHARVHLAGPGGEAWLEVLMTPEPAPRAQTLQLQGTEPRW